MALVLFGNNHKQLFVTGKRRSSEKYSLDRNMKSKVKVTNTCQLKYTWLVIRNMANIDFALNRYKIFQ